MTRPGRLLSTTTRSPSRTASRTLCVTNRTVSPRSAQILSSSSCSRSRVIASSAPNGSSMSSSSASWASARASATRCRMPPDSSCGRLPAKLPRCTTSSSSPAWRRRSALGAPLARRASSTFLAAVSHGNRAGSWNMSAGRWPPVEISPDVGASSLATRFSSVLLPQPDAPIRQTNSPGATSRDSRSRASSADAPRPKTFETSLIRIPASVPAVVITGWEREPFRWATLMSSPVVVRRLSAMR